MRQLESEQESQSTYFQTSHLPFRDSRFKLVWKGVAVPPLPGQKWELFRFTYFEIIKWVKWESESVPRAFVHAPGENSYLIEMSEIPLQITSESSWNLKNICN